MCRQVRMAKLSRCGMPHSILTLGLLACPTQRLISLIHESHRGLWVSLGTVKAFKRSYVWVNFANFSIILYYSVLLCSWQKRVKALRRPKIFQVIFKWGISLSFVLNWNNCIVWKHKSSFFWKLTCVIFNLPIKFLVL